MTGHTVHSVNYKDGYAKKLTIVKPKCNSFFLIYMDCKSLISLVVNHRVVAILALAVETSQMFRMLVSLQNWCKILFLAAVAIR